MRTPLTPQRAVAHLHLCRAVVKACFGSLSRRHGCAVRLCVHRVAGGVVEVSVARSLPRRCMVDSLCASALTPPGISYHAKRQDCSGFGRVALRGTLPGHGECRSQLARLPRCATSLPHVRCDHTVLDASFMRASAIPSVATSGTAGPQLTSRFQKRWLMAPSTGPERGDSVCSRQHLSPMIV